MTYTEVTAEPLSAAAHLAAVEGPDRGACVLFTGEVRDHDGGRQVIELEYVAHPTATDILREVAAEVVADIPEGAVAISHRIGLLKVGDIALVAAVSAPHRGQAFTACQRLVDEAKRRLPIWKRQVFLDGTEEWVNFP